MNNTKLCPQCGGSLVHESREKTCRYAKKTVKKIETFFVIYSQPGWWCRLCGEGIIEGEDHQHFKDVFSTLRAKVEGVLTPKQISSIRKNMGISKRKASLLVGGGHNAFQRYESGEICPSSSTSALISLLGLRPELQQLLPSLQNDPDKKFITLPTQNRVEIHKIAENKPIQS